MFEAVIQKAEVQEDLFPIPLIGITMQDSG